MRLADQEPAQQCRSELWNALTESRTRNACYAGNFERSFSKGGGWEAYKKCLERTGDITARLVCALVEEHRASLLGKLDAISAATAAPHAAKVVLFATKIEIVRRVRRARQSRLRARIYRL